MPLLAKLLTLKAVIETNYRDYLGTDRDFNVDRIELDKNHYQFKELTNKTPIEDQLEQSHQAVITAVDQYCKNIDTLIEFVRSEVNREHEQYCQQVNQLLADMDTEISKKHTNLLNKTPTLKINDREMLSTIILSLEQNNEVKKLVKFHVSKYVNWRYPGLLIRPSLSLCTGDMVGFDPLYFVDYSVDYITPEIEKFNGIYKNRIQSYTINDQSDEPILSKLPQGQFGCVVAHNFFNYRSYQLTCRYLAEVYELLRPGGVFIFTFTDCDFTKAIELAEQHKSTYIPGHLVKETAKEIGYQTIHYITVDDQTTCVELKKPGELSSIRGGQALARIMPN